MGRTEGPLNTITLSGPFRNIGHLLRCEFDPAQQEMFGFACPVALFPHPSIRSLSYRIFPEYMFGIGISVALTLGEMLLIGVCLRILLV